MNPRSSSAGLRLRLADAVRRVAFQRSLASRPCGHEAAARDIVPGTPVCQPCADQGNGWAQLRMCLSCGSIGCCDSSPDRHARAHFDATGHPVMRSIEPGQAWQWCYLDQAYLPTRPTGQTSPGTSASR